MGRTLDDVPVEPTCTECRTCMRAPVFDRVQLAVHVEDDHGAPVMPHQRSLACLGDLLGFQSQWCHGSALNSGEMNGMSLLTPEFECECEAPRVDAVPVDSLPNRFQGTRTVAPVVARDSRARCACAAS